MPRNPFLKWVKNVIFWTLHWINFHHYRLFVINKKYNMKNPRLIIMEYKILSKRSIGFKRLSTGKWDVVSNCIDVLMRSLKSLSCGICNLGQISQDFDLNIFLTVYDGEISTWRTVFLSSRAEYICNSQNRALRMIFKLGKTETSRHTFKQYKILTIPSIVIYKILLLIKTNKRLFPMAPHPNNFLSPRPVENI